MTTNERLGHKFITVPRKLDLTIVGILTYFVTALFALGIGAIITYLNESTISSTFMIVVLIFPITPAIVAVLFASTDKRFKRQKVLHYHLSEEEQKQFYTETITKKKVTKRKKARK